MFGFKPLILLLVAGLAVACQQPAKPAAETYPGLDALSKEMAKNAERDDYTPTEPFRAKSDELGLLLAERLLSGCIRTSGQEPMKTCFHERMLAGFDTDGTLERNCPEQDDLEADFKCIVLGGMARHLAARAGDDAMESLDWNRPEESANEISNRFVLRQVRDCLSNGAASDPSDCVLKRITNALDLTRPDIEPCDALMDQDYSYGQCIGEAFSYKYIKGGLARM